MTGEDSRDEMLKAVAEIADKVDALEQGAKLGSWVIVYEVNTPLLEDVDGHTGYTQICFSAEDPRAWVQEGLLQAGVRCAQNTASANDLMEDGE